MGNQYIKWNPTELQLSDIIQLYKTKSIAHIAKQYGKDPSTIKRILVENNISIKNLSDTHKLPIDANFFNSIDTEEKAYWLGFIYADGYITKCNGHSVFGIKLKIEDKDHIVKFKNAIHSEHKIIEGVIESPYGVSRACSITIANEEFVHCLLDKGVFYNKSKILKPPPQEKLPNNLVSHFIRGYFDGDGSIYLGKAKKDNWKSSGNVSFIGTYELLSWILNNLKEQCSTKANIYKYKNKDIWEIKIGGNTNFLNLYEYLYKDANIFLSRKKDKADFIKTDVQRL